MVNFNCDIPIKNMITTQSELVGESVNWQTMYRSANSCHCGKPHHVLATHLRLPIAKLLHTAVEGI